MSKKSWESNAVKNMPVLPEKKKKAVNVRELDASESEYWDREMERFEFVHPFDAYGWGQVRAADNWNPIYLAAERDGVFAGGMILLEKKVPFTRFSIFYTPRGPLWDYEDVETLRALIEKMKEVGRRRGALFVRVAPNIPESRLDEKGDRLMGAGFIRLDRRWTYWNTPRDNYRIPMYGKSEDDLFKALHTKARQGIRRATNGGITIRCAESKEDLAVFYRLFSAFAEKKRFMARGYHYLERLWKEYIAKGRGTVFLAEYRGKIIGGQLNLTFGKFCAEMHRAVEYEYHSHRVNDLLVWEGIKTAKKADCQWYSMRGAGPTPSHDKFKEKFASVVSLVGYYDYPFKPFLYKLFCFAEFSVLPRVWSLLLRGRKIYHAIRMRREQDAL